jgi:hypothetical protein
MFLRRCTHLFSIKSAPHTMRKTFLIFTLTGNIFLLHAQNKDAIKPRPITIAEYDKAKSYTIKDLDKDSYVKFENKYVLDRYEMRKPYFITGDDGLKKRIDLYKLIAKDSMQELGTMIFYTNEKGKVYSAVQPNFTADAKVWNKYFEDIDQINKEEKNFVLKLSYVLSKEMSFQLYKAINNGKDMKEEAGTYGTHICFPRDQLVAMADGTSKAVSLVKPGDKIISLNPVTKKAEKALVKKLVEHEAKNYAITSLTVLAANEQITTEGTLVKLSAKVVKATPNHPMETSAGKLKIGDVNIGDNILCFDNEAGVYKKYTVFNKSESAGGVQKVYNMEVLSGSTFIMNGVMVLQK